MCDETLMGERGLRGSLEVDARCSRWMQRLGHEEEGLPPAASEGKVSDGKS